MCKFVEENNREFVDQPNKHFLPSEQHFTKLQKHVIHSMSKLILGPVKTFNVMKTVFGGFEDVISSKVDFTNYKRVLCGFVPFADIDNHHNNVTFSDAVLASETTDTCIWLLRVFLKAAGDQPKVVVTDQDPTMKKTIFVFESGWEEVIKEFNLADNDWLSDVFALKESWIPAFYRIGFLSGLMLTTSRSESENHLFGQVMSTFFLFLGACNVLKVGLHQQLFMQAFRAV
ncbi:uncharacterized protein LOC110866927 [Helianthus annuus]|uniref:uncharacterized protein LOC110866927 n=1 Tax=Helianthus annuus TaxID=4232 RepID=UPI000B8F2EF2|nr:uncharacterized protein LOC110866927 [Helianthus annuus]